MYTISYPSGTLRKDGIVFPQDDTNPVFQEYVAWLTSDPLNGPQQIQDPPPPPQIIVPIGKMLQALEQANASAYQEVLNGLQIASDDSNLMSIFDGIGVTTQDSYAVFEAAQSL